MNELMTKNNHFTVDETLMEKVFEACDYKFMVIKLNNNESNFIAREVADGLGYAHTDSLVRSFRRKDLEVVTINYKNGLDDLKIIINEYEEQLVKKTSRSYISDTTPSLLLFPSSSLQEYLLRHSKLPKAKIVADKLYEVLSGSYIIQTSMVEEVESLEEIDEVNQALMKTFFKYPQAIEVSKEIQRFFKSLVFIPNQQPPGFFNWIRPGTKTPMWLNYMMGYHNSCIAFFIPNKKAVKKIILQQGFSPTVMQSFRNFLRFICPATGSVIATIDRQFIKKVNLRIEEHRNNGMSHFWAVKETLSGTGTIKKLVTEVIEEYDFLMKTQYWLKHEGLLEEAYQQFLDDTRYVTKKDLSLKRFLQIPDWNATPLLEQQYKLLGE